MQNPKPESTKSSASRNIAGGLTIVLITVAVGFIQCDAETWASWGLLIAAGLGSALGLGIGMVLWGAINGACACLKRAHQPI